MGVKMRNVVPLCKTGKGMMMASITAQEPYGRDLHRFSADAHPVPGGPPKLWTDHAGRMSRELPMWMLSTRQIAAADSLPADAAYRMARVTNVVALTHNLCLTFDPFALEVYLANLDPDMRGFAVEGVGMGLFTREVAGDDADGMLDRFLARTGARFSGLAYTGVGLGHVHTRTSFDPALLDRWSGVGRWMVLDGLGFWAAKMDWDRFGLRQELYDGVEETHRRIFDRGLGRSGWFENGTVVARVADWVRSFPEDRRRDVALGVGVAATFTGGVEGGDLTRLRDELAPFAADLAAGSINAGETRFAVGIDTAYTERATQAFAGLSVPRSFHVAQAARLRLADDSYDAVLAWYDALRDMSVDRVDAAA